MRFSFLGISVCIERNDRRSRAFSNVKIDGAATYKLHFGPGPNWSKPDVTWLAVDADPRRGDLVVDWNQCQRLPIRDSGVSHIYGSHVFEHMSIFAAPRIFKECFRVLSSQGVMRLVLPDARKSVEKYLEGEDGFELFRRRRERAMHRGVSYTRWECMRECFLSASQQQKVLGSETLAHQNAWDFETIERDLLRVGFSSVEQSAFQSSGQSAFSFEGCFESEANEDYRSLYVEATKS